MPKVPKLYITRDSTGIRVWANPPRWGQAWATSTNGQLERPVGDYAYQMSAYCAPQHRFNGSLGPFCRLGFHQETGIEPEMNTMREVWLRLFRSRAQALAVRAPARKRKPAPKGSPRKGGKGQKRTTKRQKKGGRRG